MGTSWKLDKATTMGSRMSMAWLLLLFLKVSGLKGELDDSIKLQCYQLLVPSHVLNCTWFIQRSLDVATTYVLHCQSLKFQPNQTHSERAERGQNWLIIGRSKLTQGENYSIWLEVFSAHWNATSNKLYFNLDDIVKPPPPVLEPVESDSAGALVTWKNPHWSEFHSHHALMCALRYKTSTNQGWTYLPNEEVGQEGHDLEDLKPFTSYEVQARCIPENGNGFWSDWSLSQIFQTPEAAPLGPVDVWQKVGASENGELSHLLLWKALDPESARGVILDYEVIYQEHNNSTHKTQCPCCNASLPPTAKYAWVSARNSIKKTLPANLSLEQTGKN
ncbi:hypothetical protein JRQ81_003561 [Phrynocephalus forsythii]|uniref:Fibronectin type-III domain-containing protein n=1 Tax=Phrynocephalus forsythii TaxID=171643 RepID=A0A9Q1AXI7_9SAUR|nr:hypothetical protein JRQ81_003561 [Phrynocephalus forsythii]